MVDYRLCACLLAIVVLIIIFALLIRPRITKKMLAGDIDKDTKKIVHVGVKNYPGYVSLIYINIKDIDKCIEYISSSNDITGDKKKCSTFLRKLIPISGGIKSFSILKPGEVAGVSYRSEIWGTYIGGNSGGSVMYGDKPSINTSRMSADLDHCPELQAHRELLPLRSFVTAHPQEGIVHCFYIGMGNCGALGLTEDMFHGLTRKGLKSSCFKNNLIEFYSSSSLAIPKTIEINLDIAWPRTTGGMNGLCEGLTRIDMSETIVGIGNDARYESVYTFVKKSIIDYINERKNFTVPGITQSGLWISLQDVLNLDPLKCRAENSNERGTCF